MASAVEREVMEETGVAVTCGAFVGWVERISDAYHFVIMDFWASVEPSTAKPKPTAADDADEARWIDKRDVLDLDLVDGLGSFLVGHGVL